MSDASVRAALRSPARLVVIEAPAGCGKTFQGSKYAADISGTVGRGRVLVLTHTHAVCDVFASATCGAQGNVEIRTIDSLISQIATAYHQALELPADPAAWARTRKNGYDELARRVAVLIRASPMVPRSLAVRYPIVICDEHQDASADQHEIVMACYEAGAAVRIFGDPMQRIYGSKKKAEIEADKQRWEHLKEKANAFEELDEPHRWADGSDALGRWILAARAALRSGAQIDLGGPLPQSVSIVVGENESPKQRGGYRLAKANAKPIYSLVKQMDSLLVLASHNETVNALRAFFGRQLPIWEGHVREGLSAVVGEVQEHKGDAVKIAHATVKFLGHVTTGFSLSAYGNTFLDEVSAGCAGKRNGKPATLQGLGRLLLEEPNHRGIAKVLQRLRELITSDPAFRAVKIDYHREFWDAVRLAQFDDPDEGLAEISRRRSYARPSLPAKAISTIHKAKGLECRNALILPCDAQHFAESPAARCRLYVAMSRPTHSLTFVVSQKTPSPLFKL